MIKPKCGEMNYKNIEELAFNYMFISACLSDIQKVDLEAAWDAAGGFKNKSWWKFVMENTKLELDIK